MSAIEHELEIPTEYVHIPNDPTNPGRHGRYIQAPNMKMEFTLTGQGLQRGSQFG